MKKHFTGIALFVFIVGISGFVASLFVEIQKPEVFEFTETVPRYESRTKCSKKYQSKKSDVVTAKITQAVYNEKTKRLYADFLVERGKSDYNSAWINLHFYVKTADKMRYLTTEQITISPEFSGKSVATGREDLSFLSLNELDSHENIYVIAEPATQFWDKDKLNEIGEKAARAYLENDTTAVLVVEK